VPAVRYELQRVDNNDLALKTRELDIRLVNFQMMVSFTIQKTDGILIVLYVRAIQPSCITEHSQNPYRCSVASTITPRASPVVLKELWSSFCTSVGSTIQHATSNMSYIYKLQDEELFVFKNQEHQRGNCKHRSFI